jgi:hypothetical protein
MISNDISKAKNPDLRNAIIALRRASIIARQTAIQTGTSIVTIRDGRLVRIPVEELVRYDQAPPTAE